jgi:hypothetical protein
LRSGVDDLSEVRRALPDGLQVIEVPGTRIGEVMAIAENDDDIAWLVCDAFFNMPRLSGKLPMRTLSKLMKSAPGLCISSLMKWGGVNDRAAYKGWLIDQLGSSRPSIMAPAHGDIARGDDLATRIETLVNDRL